MKKKKQLLLATVSALPLMVFAGSLAFGADDFPSSEDKCVAGEQCLVESDATISRSGETYTATQGGSALFVWQKGAFQGSSVTLSAPDEGSRAAFFMGEGVIGLEGATIDGWRGISGMGTLKLSNSTINVVDEALSLQGASVSTLDDVHITVKGQENGLLATAIRLRPSDGSRFTMNGGTLISDTNWGFKIESVSGGSNQIDLNDVTIVASGRSAIDAMLEDNDVLNIGGGTITHSGDMGWAVALSGGRNLIDGTKIVAKNTAISAGSVIDTTSLVMRNFDVETMGGSSTATGLIIQGDTAVQLADGKIKTQSGYGIHIISPTSSQPLLAERVTIETNGAQGTAHGFLNSYGHSILRDVDIIVNGDNSGIWSDGYGLTQNGIGTTHANIEMLGGSITVNGSGNSMGVMVGAMASQGGVLTLDDVDVTVTNNTSGVSVVSGSTATVKNSHITAHGEYSTGLTFNGTPSLAGEEVANRIIVTGSKINSRDGAGVRVSSYEGTDTLDIRGSVMAGDSLAIIGNSSYGGIFSSSDFTFNADASQLFGHAFMQDQSKWTMNLTGNSVWTLRPSNNINTTFDDGLIKGRSDVTFLNVSNSHILFDSSGIFYNSSGDGLYQTLVVGSGDRGGRRDVYHAGAGAHITLNTWLNSGGVGNQKTDRLLINGDVTGSTTVHINPIAHSPGGSTHFGTPMAFDGISIIQASGKAEVDSFALAGGYVAYGPFKYVLYAYGPEDTATPASVTKYGGLAHVSERLVDVEAQNWDHWDWRLQAENLTPPPGGGTTPPPPPANGGNVPTPPNNGGGTTPPPNNGGGTTPPPAPFTANVVPQVPSYLVAPTALFQANMLDFMSLHHQLADIRTAANGSPDDGRGAFFMRAYGGDYDYTSNRRLSQYGYDADIRYTAMQIGGHLYGFETENGIMRFGLAGSYGDLSFKPHGVDEAHKTNIDIWSVSPFVTWQHQSGGYANVMIAYGGFDGTVSTDLRGNTARLEGHSYAASVEMGMPFALPMGGLTLEPQAQIIYQRLEFDRKRDIDGFAVDIGDPDQWLVRVGGKMQKSFARTRQGSDIKLYGKLNLLHAFGDENQIWLDHNFYSGRFGTHLETGIGIDAALFGRASLYGDMSWAERVSSSGSSGITLNGGLKASF